MQDACRFLSDKLNKVRFQKTEYDEAVTAKELAKKEQLKIIRAILARLKKAAAYTGNLGAQLGAVGSTIRIDTQELKPAIRLSLVPTGVKVSFNKRRMPAVGIYSRIKGAADWMYIGSQDKSPFIDTRSLVVADKPEIREYRAICRDAVREIGITSASEEIVYGGPNGIMP
jgi:hypothetical protein